MTFEPPSPENLAAKGAEALIGKLFGPAVENLGQIIGDHVRLWRYRNLDAIRRKIEDEAKARGIEVKLKVLPTGIGLALVEAASRVEDESLQALWARLLLNYGRADDEKAALTRLLVETVGSFEPLDAKVLQFLDSKGWLLFGNVAQGGFDCDRIASELSLEASEVAMSISNLWRLGCLVQQVTGRQRIDVGGLDMAGPTHAPGVAYIPSPLGRAILEAVREIPSGNPAPKK